MMYFVITIVLMFNSTAEQGHRVYLEQTFKDTWACHKYIHENKIKLLTPHVIEYGDELKSFEFFCDNRYAEEV